MNRPNASAGRPALRRAAWAAAAADKKAWIPPALAFSSSHTVTPLLRPATRCTSVWAAAVLRRPDSVRSTSG